MSQYWKYRRQVLRLYKNILIEHKKLPFEMKKLGNEYLRSEFKLHKNLAPNSDEARTFLLHWKNYNQTLKDQLAMGFSQPIGKDIDQEQFSKMDEDQKQQLKKLKEEVESSLKS